MIDSAPVYPAARTELKRPRPRPVALPDAGDVAAVRPAWSVRYDVAYAVALVRRHEARRLRSVEKRTAVAAVVLALVLVLLGPATGFAVLAVLGSGALFAFTAHRTVVNVQEAERRRRGEFPVWPARLPIAYLRAVGVPTPPGGDDTREIAGELALEDDAWRWYPDARHRELGPMVFSRGRGVTLRRSAGVTGRGYLLIGDREGTVFCLWLRDVDDCGRHLEELGPDLVW